jgi:hypothetical protein
VKRASSQTGGTWRRRDALVEARRTSLRLPTRDTARLRAAISRDIIPVVPDVLIRDVPVEDLARIDAHAARLGLSRTEYLRRRLRQEAARPVGPVTTADLHKFAARFADLGDPEVMRRAWS